MKTYVVRSLPTSIISGIAVLGIWSCLVLQPGADLDEDFREIVPGEEVPDACCIFNLDCVKTEILCSAHAPLACKLGGEVGYFRVLVADRTNCVTGYSGKTCTRDFNYTACAYDVECEFDEAIDTCIASTFDGVLVNDECDDDCS